MKGIFCDVIEKRVIVYIIVAITIKIVHLLKRGHSSIDRMIDERPSSIF